MNSESQTSPSAPPNRPLTGIWLSLLTGVCLVAITLLVFWPVVNAGFLSWDDDLNITGNPHIRALDGPHLRWMLTDYSHARRHMPLTWLTWAAVYHFFGLNPVAYHLLNLLFHSANALLIFWILHELLARRTHPPPTSPARIVVPAGVAALFWAIHPLRVEVTAWANCQVYSEALSFLLLSFLCYLKYSAARAALKTLYYALSLLLFTASLLVYPIGLLSPVVLLVLDAYPGFNLLPRPFRTTARFWADKLPFFLLVAASVLINLWARAHVSGLWAAHTLSLQQFPLPNRLGQAFYIWARYLWKSLVPTDLSPVYTTLLNFNPFSWPFLLSFVAVTAITLGLFWLRRRWPLGLATWLCYLTLLVPMLGLTEHPHYPNDRYSYVVAIPASLLIAAGLWKAWLHRGLRLGLLLVSLAVAATLGNLTRQQTAIWRDSETFLRHLLAELKGHPYSATIHARLGLVLIQKNEFAAARSQFDSALRLSPDVASAHFGLAALALQKNDLRAAETHLAESIRIEPFHAIACKRLAWLLATAPDPSLRDGARAVQLAQQACALEGPSASNLDTLAAAYAEAGRFEEAVQAAEQAIQAAEQTGQTKAVPLLRRHLQYFQSRKPYHHPQ